MKLRFGIMTIAAMLLLVCALISACSSESEDVGNGDGGSPGSGSATLTIGDESWSFDEVRCGFSQEETFLPKQSFYLSAFGSTAEGVQIELSATILDEQEDGRYFGNGVSYAVSIVDAEDSESPTFEWVSLTGLFGEVEPVIQVDGKNVTADTSFRDHVTITGNEIPGTLRATCP
jgi:hypothetical protein